MARIALGDFGPRRGPGSNAKKNDLAAPRLACRAGVGASSRYRVSRSANGRSLAGGGCGSRRCRVLSTGLANSFAPVSMPVQSSTPPSKTVTALTVCNVCCFVLPETDGIETEFCMPCWSTNEPPNIIASPNRIIMPHAMVRSERARLGRFLNIVQKGFTTCFVPAPYAINEPLHTTKGARRCNQHATLPCPAPPARRGA